MNTAIKILFLIFVTSVTATYVKAFDLRFPIDAKVIKGTLNEGNIIHIYYEANEKLTAVDYFLKDTQRTCGSYKIELNDGEVFQHFKVIPLNQDDVLVIPMTAYNPANKAEIINLSTCKKSGIVLSTEGKPTDLKVTAYADSFDIYIKDSSACKDNYCRKSYNFEGKVVSAPFKEFHSGKSIPSVIPIGSKARSNKYLAVEFAQDKTILNLVDSGRSKVLAETTDTDFSPEVSTSNNLISLAYRDDGINMKLKQFDLEGNLKFETLVKYTYFIRTAKVVNAANGGAYIVSSECDRDHCDDEQNSYTVKKIDANGKELGSLLLKFPLPGIIQDVSFYEEKGSICLTRSQLSLGVSGMWEFKKLDTNFRCFNDKDFS